MIEPFERLRKAREEAGFSSAANAAKRLGVPYQTYVAHENGNRAFKSDLARKYASAFRVEPEWLLFGGQRSEDVPEVVHAGEGVESDEGLVAVYDVSASAGYGMLAESEELAAYSLAFPPNYLKKLTRSNPKNLSIISVKGDSMEPTLHDDDIVMLDFSKRDLNFDGLFVLRFGETLHVKRVARSSKREHVKIISDNREVYPPEVMHLSDVEVVGKVIWKGGKV
jgi:phage repressor protein C with HTH and peptisase S24 domain